MNAFFALCLSFFNIVFRGYVIKTFWAWFILTQFPNLPRIETAAGIGFAFFVAAVSPWKSASGKELADAMDKENTMNKYSSLLNNVGHLVGALALLGMGYVIHHYFM